MWPTFLAKDGSPPPREGPQDGDLEMFRCLMDLSRGALSELDLEEAANLYLEAGDLLQRIQAHQGQSGGRSAWTGINLAPLRKGDTTSG